jgi:hypothetical protein
VPFRYGALGYAIFNLAAWGLGIALLELAARRRSSEP